MFCCIYSSLQGPSASAYVTYFHVADALRAIQSVNNVHVDGRTLKTSLGTTKYCSHFLRSQQCTKSVSWLLCQWVCLSWTLNGGLCTCMWLFTVYWCWCVFEVCTAGYGYGEQHIQAWELSVKTQISVAVKLTPWRKVIVRWEKKFAVQKEKRKHWLDFRVVDYYFFQINSHACILMRSRTSRFSRYFVFHASRGSQCRRIRIRTLVRKSEKERTVCFSLFFPHHW